MEIQAQAPALDTELYRKERMDFSIIAEYMWPCWALGVAVLLGTAVAGKKDLIRIEKKPVWDWFVFLFIVLLIRIVMFKFLGYSGLFGKPTGLMSIPLAASFTVFWEDACHGLPLVILGNLIGTKSLPARIINALAVTLVSVSFGLGHLYQGPLVAGLIMCFYISYSIKYGKKYGFGTVMICHTMFDFFTFLFVKYFLS